MHQLVCPGSPVTARWTGVTIGNGLYERQSVFLDCGAAWAAARIPRREIVSIPVLNEIAEPQWPAFFAGILGQWKRRVVTLEVVRDEIDEIEAEGVLLDSVSVEGSGPDQVIVIVLSDENQMDLRRRLVRPERVLMRINEFGDEVLELSSADETLCLSLWISSPRSVPGSRRPQR